MPKQWRNTDCNAVSTVRKPGMSPPKSSIEAEKRETIERASKQEQVTRDVLTKTEAELKAVKGELKTERLKNSAAEVGTTIIDGIGAMIGTSKVKRQEQEIDRLQHEVAARDESIESLQKKITTMQSDHSRELTTMQARHATELTNKEKQHEKENIELINGRCYDSRNACRMRQQDRCTC